MRVDPAESGFHVVDARTGRRLLNTPAAAWALSADGHALYLAGGDGKINVWDLRRWSPIATLPGFPGTIIALTVSDDGRLLATMSATGVIAVHDRTKMPLIGHTAEVKAVAYSPDGRTIASAGGADSQVILWDPVSRRPRTVLPPAPQAAHVNAVAYSPDGRLLATGGHAARLWDTATGKQIGEVGIHRPGVVDDLVFSADGRQLAARASDGPGVSLGDVRSRAPLEYLHCFTGLGLAANPRTEQFACGGGDRGVVFFDDTGHETGRTKILDNAVSSERTNPERAVAAAPRTSTPGSPPSAPTTFPTCTPSPTASNATIPPSSTASPCPTAQARSRAT